MLYSYRIRVGTKPKRGKEQIQKLKKPTVTYLTRAARNTKPLAAAPLWRRPKRKWIMKKLELPLHPHLETIFGYPGDAPKVVFYWEPESDKLMYDDGFESGTANAWAYLIWAAHPSVKPLLTQSEHPILLLERRGRKLFSVSRMEALEALEVSGVPDLSLHAGKYDEHVEDYQSEEAVEAIPWKEAQQLLADFVIWLGSGLDNRRAA